MDRRNWTEEMDCNEGIERGKVDTLISSPFSSSCGTTEVSTASRNWVTKVSIADVRRPRVARSLPWRKFCFVHFHCVFNFFETFALSFYFLLPASPWLWHSFFQGSGGVRPGPGCRWIFSNWILVGFNVPIMHFLNEQYFKRRFWKMSPFFVAPMYLPFSCVVS